MVLFVAADNPASAEALLGRIEKNLGLLSRNPQLGRVPTEEELASLRYRYLIVENYLIFYKVEKRTVFVHRILHGARYYLGLL